MDACMHPKIRLFLLCLFVVELILLGCGDEGAERIVIPLSPETASSYTQIPLSDFSATPLIHTFLRSTVHISVDNVDYPAEATGFVCAPNLIVTGISRC